MPAQIRSLAALALGALAACGDLAPPGATVERGNAPALAAAQIESAAAEGGGNAAEGAAPEAPPAETPAAEAPAVEAAA